MEWPKLFREKGGTFSEKTPLKVVLFVTTDGQGRRTLQLGWPFRIHPCSY